jgi:hypothetical protein
MFGPRRYLAAAMLLVMVVSACSSNGATMAPSSNHPVPSAGGGGTTATATATAAAGGGALGGTVGQGGDFCALLGPGDFAAVGVSGARAATKNSDAPTDAYCVYSGVSGATGGIEFDIFLGDPVATYQQIKSNGGILADDATGDLPGVDAAGTQSNASGWADIGVRKGQMSFDIDVPASSGARAQLITLAKLVLQRGSGLSS